MAAHHSRASKMFSSFLFLAWQRTLDSSWIEVILSFEEDRTRNTMFGLDIKKRGRDYDRINPHSALGKRSPDLEAVMPVYYPEGPI